MRLNFAAIIRVLGILTCVEGAFLLPCVPAALYFGERDAVWALLLVSLLCLAAGGCLILALRRCTHRLRGRESLLAAGMGWVWICLIGMLPLYIWGRRTGQNLSLMSCWFEAVAGFTTTGCTVLNTDLMPLSLLLWRALSYWIGGMGILLLITFLLPYIGTFGQSTPLAEMSGTGLQKAGAATRETAKYLFTIYLSLTGLEFLLLWLGPMDWFTALISTFSSISTSGLIIASANVSIFSNLYVRLVILVFTVLSSISYLLYFGLVRGRGRAPFAALEAKWYLRIIAIATVLIAVFLYGSGTYGSLFQALKDGLCQVVSLISTSGYYVCDYTRWPAICQTLLFVLICIGGCSISTAGSLKVLRVLVMVKLVRRGIFRRIHPQAVKPVQLGGHTVSASMASSITIHILLFLGIFMGGALLLSFNNLDMETTLTAAMGALSNAGIALGQVGATGYFGMFNGFSQFILSLLMLIGRLEIYAILLPFTRAFWKPDSVRAL